MKERGKRGKNRKRGSKRGRKEGKVKGMVGKKEVHDIRVS